MKRGEVWEAILEPRSGSEQRGKRPVIVLMRENFLRAPGWRSIILVPVSTSARQSARGPTAVALVAGAGGLLSYSTALCHQITTLDRAKLAQRYGELSPEDLRRVEEGVLIAQGITPP